MKGQLARVITGWREQRFESRREGKEFVTETNDRYEGLGQVGVRNGKVGTKEEIDGWGKNVGSGRDRIRGRRKGREIKEEIEDGN